MKIIIGETPEKEKDLLVDNRFPRIITQKYKIEHIRNQFKQKMGYEPDIETPKTFSEKLQWLKLFYRKSLMSRCSDKYAVRQYIKKTIGDKYLINLEGRGVYGSASSLDFNELPERFVLKTTDGWGTNIICKNKLNLDFESTKRRLSEWLDKGRSHYYRNFEWAYKNIRPRIICEEYLEQAGGLKEYKFACFGGRVGYIDVVTDRGTDECKLDCFNREWKRLYFTRGRYSASINNVDPPQTLEEMIRISEILSQKFPFVRIDLYETNDEVKVGELTFYPGNGTNMFYPPEWDDRFGELLSLPRKSFVLPFEINKRIINPRAIIRNIVRML